MDNPPERSTEPVQIYQIGQRHVAIASRGGGWYQTFIICLLVERLKQEGNIRKRSDMWPANYEDFLARLL